MPSVLDSFVLEFGIDASQLTRQQQGALNDLKRFEDAALKGGQNIESATKKTFDLLSNFRREALTTLALFFGGKEVGQFVDHITKLDAATGRLGVTIGMSARETSAWQGAIRQAGGSTEGANAALAGLSGEMNRFQLTGQSAMLPVLSRLGLSLYDQNRNLKTSGQLWLELSDAISGMDPRQATAFLQMIPGANEDMINFALLGRKAMEQYLDAARKVGTTTEQSAAAAQQYRRSLEQLDAASSNLGRSLVTTLAPALTTVANSLAKLFSSWGAENAGAQGSDLQNKMNARFGSPRNFVNGIGALFGHAGAGDRIYGPNGELDAAKAALADKMRAAVAGSPAGSNNEVEAYIRQAARLRGMDPEVAIGVYRSEGARGYVGDRGSSFGPYQLHYGGMAGGGMAVSGLGDTFTKQAGLDAKNPATWKSQVDFSLDQAKKGGWGPWHGWKGSPFAGINAGSGGGGKSVTVNVGGVTVNAPGGDADSIANGIDGSLKRSIGASAANYGPQ